MLITSGLEEVQLMVDHTVRRLVPIHCGSVRLEVTSVPAVLTKLCFLQKQILTVITAVGWALSRLWKKKENSVAALV